ncbi:hypothetical protein KR044_012327 [Drosophila immigrans]|nr:hypothetical protein KR044_012327 [Drosophila immigrans]
MSRCLSETLIKYQNDFAADIKIIADKAEEPEKAFIDGLCASETVTNEDLSRIYTESEVRQLCLRTKLRVNMTLFNCLWEAKKRFDEKGRLDNRSERFINAMYIKAVKRGMVIPYEEEEISRCVHIQRCKLKKRNNCRLDHWRRLEKGASLSSSSLVYSDEDSDPSLMLAQLPNRTMPNSPKTAVQIVYPATIESDSSSSLNASEPQLWSVKKRQFEDKELSKNVESEDKLLEDTKSKDKELSKNHESEVIQLFNGLSDKSLDWVEAAVQINPESMTIDLDTETPQTESQSIADNYLVFNTQVPCTSTQSTHYTEDLL